MSGPVLSRRAFSNLQKDGGDGCFDPYVSAADDQFMYAKSFPSEDSTLVTLMNMLFAHICGALPAAVLNLNKFE